MTADTRAGRIAQQIAEKAKTASQAVAANGGRYARAGMLLPLALVAAGCGEQAFAGGPAGSAGGSGTTNYHVTCGVISQTPFITYECDNGFSNSTANGQGNANTYGIQRGLVTPGEIDVQITTGGHKVSGQQGSFTVEGGVTRPRLTRILKPGTTTIQTESCVATVTTTDVNGTLQVQSIDQTCQIPQSSVNQ